jgi:hypothetical protein
MTFAWSQSLQTLRDSVKKRGLEHGCFRHGSQAAFFRAASHRTQDQFPAQGADMMPTLADQK